MNHAWEAMQFARRMHRDQQRKYTGNPYHDHLAEVAGICAAAGIVGASADTITAVSWLHDTIEDTDATYLDLFDKFGAQIADSVMLLSDWEIGNRATRKEAARVRLAAAPGWVQSIKCADLISNASSIVRHDPKFAQTYLGEMEALLAVMVYADGPLHRMARDVVEHSIERVARSGLPPEIVPATSSEDFPDTEGGSCD